MKTGQYEDKGEGAREGQAGSKGQWIFKRMLKIENWQARRRRRPQRRFMDAGVKGVRDTRDENT